MFSIKALILYVLFFVIGWLLARWLWNKKQTEMRETSSSALAGRSAASSASVTHSPTANADSSTAEAPTPTASKNDDNDDDSSADTVAAAMPATKSTPPSATKVEKTRKAGKAAESPAVSAASLKSSSADSAEPETKALDEEASQSDTPELLKGARDGEADDLKKIKGVGKKIEEKLNGFGIFHFDQIANWTDDQAKWIGSELAFTGRIERENWIEQAKVLASGGDTEFSRRVDKGKVSSSKS